MRPQKPAPSPTLVNAIEHFVAALHAAYPTISTHGVFPMPPGEFNGRIADEWVYLLPRRCGDRLYLMATKGRRKNTEYVRFGFKLRKRGTVYLYGDDDEEMVLLVWLSRATAELRRLASEIAE